MDCKFASVIIWDFGVIPLCTHPSIPCGCEKGASCAFGAQNLYCEQSCVLMSELGGITWQQGRLEESPQGFWKHREEDLGNGSG